MTTECTCCVQFYSSMFVLASVQSVENASYHSASLITHVRLVYEGQIPTLWFESLPDSTNQVICEYMYDDYCHQMKGHLLLGKCIRDIGNVETRQRAPDLCAHVGYQSLLAIDSEKEKKITDCQVNNGGCLVGSAKTRGKLQFFKWDSSNIQ